MITIILFAIIAAVLVFIIGRKDTARDPRLTLTLLLLLAAYPIISLCMPKLLVVPTKGLQPDESEFPWSRVILAVWLGGVLVSTVRLILSHCVLLRWRQRSILIKQINHIEIRSLKTISSPLATGIFRKIVYVPKSWNQQTKETKKVILAHEINHHRRLDPLWKLLAEIACVIHWFNPLVHWMARRLALQCELACDAEVLSQGADKSSYAKLLCDLATHEHHPLLAVGMAGQSTLEQRVRRIMNPSHRSNVLVMVACGLLGMGSALALSMITSQKEPEVSPAIQDAQLRLSADPFPGNP